MGGYGECGDMEIDNPESQLEVDKSLNTLSKTIATSNNDEVQEAKESDEVEESDSVRFNPPIYLQRYSRVREVLKSYLETDKYNRMFTSTGATVMELGCAEFGMYHHFKSILNIGKVLFVDIDEELLSSKSMYIRPLPAEYLSKISRPEALVMEAYAGCVTKVDTNLLLQNSNIWAIIAIELIEHLHPEVLRGFEETVFGILAPNLVIVTTPNSDFNEVFNLPPGKFRHWDHKFEWSRSEFQLWCKKIVSEFKNFTYRIEGIGEGPEETKHLGCVSQMAVFERRDDVGTLDNSKFSWRIETNSYKLVESITFPNYVEKRSPKQIIADEVNYFISNYIFSKSMVDQYEDEGIKEVNILFSKMMGMEEVCKACGSDPSVLKTFLEDSGYQITSGSDGLQVTMNVQEYVAANYEKQSDGFDDEIDEVYLCDDLKELDVNKHIPEEECWD